MHLGFHVTVYECPERRAQGPLLISGRGPMGAFVAERNTAGTWQALPSLPTPLVPGWTELRDELACEVLYVGVVAALWPGLDPWKVAAPPAAETRVA